MSSPGNFGQDQRFGHDSLGGEQTHSRNMYGENERPRSAYSSPLDLTGKSQRTEYPGSGGETYGAQGPYANAGRPYGDGHAAGQQYEYPQKQEIDVNYKLTPEENLILKECARESTMKRSLPFSAILATMTHLGVKKGYLMPHPKYGSTFKVMFAGVAGYMLGKLSYYKECEDKFLNLPNSRIADAIRRRRQGNMGLPPAPTQPYPGASWPQPSGGSVPRPYDGYGQRGPAYGYDSQASTRRNEQSSGLNTDDHFSSLDIDSEKNTYQEGRGGGGEDRGGGGLDIDSEKNNYQEGREGGGLDIDSEKNKYQAGREGGRSSLDMDTDKVDERSFDRSRDDSLRPSANYDDMRRQHRDTYFRPNVPSQGRRE